MTCAKTLLMGLRVLVVVVAAAVIGLGAWTKATVHDVEIRGNAVLDTLRLEPASKDDAWRRYVTTVVNGTPMVWTSIAAGCVTFLIGTLIILSLKLPRLTMSLNFLAPLEFLSMLAMGGAFGASLSLFLNLDVFEAETRLDASNSPDLMSFAMLIPMSKGYVIATGTGLFLVGTTAISGLVQACHRARESKCCSFEPTVSALGMGHGYQAVVPPPQRTTIPTMYDPRRPASRDAPASRDEEKGFADAGASMGRRDSALSERNKDDAAVISGPLDLEKPQTVQQMRPSRPWSEMPKKR